jgi:DnaJ-class molecular chaperone
MSQKPEELTCPECHGDGRIGTGEPSDEGGEAWRECPVCFGDGVLPVFDPDDSMTRPSKET